MRLRLYKKCTNFCQPIVGLTYKACICKSRPKRHTATHTKSLKGLTIGCSWTCLSLCLSFGKVNKLTTQLSFWLSCISKYDVHKSVTSSDWSNDIADIAREIATVKAQSAKSTKKFLFLFKVIKRMVYIHPYSVKNRI